MAKYANQKTITIHKGKNLGVFCQVPKEALYSAARILSHGAFKLWLYFASNADNYTFDFSFAHADQNLNISKSTRTRAMNELQELGYLIDKGSNHYDFYLQPDTSSPTAEPAIETPDNSSTPKYERGKTNISDSLV